MSLLKPKNEDYILRGLIFLTVWFVFGWTLMGGLGFVLFGEWGSIIGLLVYIPLGLLGFNLYLDWGLKHILQRQWDEHRRYMEGRRERMYDRRFGEAYIRESNRVLERYGYGRD